MRFVRFFLVVAVTTLACGAFGALVGVLFGSALPRELGVTAKVEASADPSGKDAPGTDAPKGGTLKVGVGSQEDAAPALRSASLGGALGLLLGAVLGFFLGVMDQVFLRATEIYGARRASGS